MSDLDALLKPFEPFLRPRWRLWWGLLLAGAPFVLALGFWIHEHRTRGPGFRMMIDRERAIAIAQETARAHGVETGGWRAHVRFEIRSATMAYFREHDVGHQFRVRRFLPEAVAQVLLIRPGHGMWVRADVGPRGFVTDFRIAGREVRAPASLPPEEVSRAAAEAELKEWIGGMAVRFLREPEMSVAADREAAGARRFTWRLEPRNAPDVELVLRVDVAGERVVGRSVEPVFAPAFLERRISKPSAASDTLEALRLLAMVFLVAYCCYRYARRSIEHEAPHARAVLLTAAFAGASLLMAFADPDTMGPRFDAEQFTAMATAIRWSVLLMTAALVGVVLGIAYGAGEGELREGWPGKITSLDAALTGRLFSANIGVSVVAGAVWACWLFCAVVLGRAALDADLTERTLRAIGFTFGRWPLVELYTDTPLQAVALSVFLLLAPLTFLRRHVRQGAVRALLLAALAALLVHDGRTADAFAAVTWLESSAVAAAVLLAFYSFDYLAAVMAAASLNLLLQIAALLATAPYWRERLDMVSLLAAALVLPLAAAAWFGRRYTDEEVRPAHAARLAERLKMEAELAAARQAQQMLLPAAPPALQSVAVAAVCDTAQEASGDSYDFFARPDGRICVAVAEGGRGGLASAMTMALAKGFLWHENAAGAGAQEALRRLESELARLPGRGPEPVGVALAILDERTGEVELARLGPGPGIWLRRREETAREPLPPRRDAAACRLRLEPGDALLFCTRGLAEPGASVAEEILSGLPQQPEAPLQPWLEALVKAWRARTSAPGRRAADLTAVVLRMGGGAAAEEAAA
ncbi:MAG: hypothetical protein KatS3mg005_2593 [Bryobacteraceae bacterium]|nr:MAG: hypothetical protein KatS3mg005_2593 [Bryobacteraceae bacterium]